MLIRNATLEDIPRMIEFGRAIHAESNMSVLSYDELKLRETLTRMLTDAKGTHCCFVAEDQERQLIGGFIGCVQEYFFSRSLVAHSILVYVDPRWRGSPAAMKFIHAFRRWALNRKAVQLTIGVASGVTVGRTDRFLKRLGFELTGGNYTIALNKAESSLAS